MRKAFSLILALGILCSCASQKNYSIQGNCVCTSTAQCNVKFTVYDSGIIRVEKYATDATASADDGMSVIMSPKKTRFKVREENGALTLSTPALSLVLDRESGAIAYSSAEKNLLMEKAGFDGKTQSFVLDTDEAVFGLGQHREGALNMRGQSLRLMNENMEIAIPLVHSAKGYAIFWNNPSITYYDDKADGMSFRSEEGSQVDYFLIYGGNADGVIAGIRELTGQVPMFPLWSYGFSQSRERYTSQDEIVGMVSWFRQNNVPLDCIVQDWQYWSEDFRHWNALEFGNPKFPNPQKMMDDIHAMNARCMISVWPSFGPETKIYKDMQEHGYLMPHATFPQQAEVRNYDPFNADARALYWEYMKKNLYDIGVDAWWLDATEPEHSPVLQSDMDFETAAGAFKNVRNLYPLPTVAGVYDAQKAINKDKRVFILTRSAALGVQQYAHCWSGDVQSSWHTLAQQIHGALNFSLSGLPYWNSDIGGFWTWENYPEGNRDPEYHKIYLRWMQFGAFTGMMRSHGANTHREIFNFGQRGDFDFDAQEKMIRLRYRLLPYIYSCAHQINAQSGTLMRALMMDWPSDARACNCGDEYLFGRNILVAPMVSDGTTREVYLPEGSWVDWRSGKPVQAGEFTADVPMDEIALYVRGGSIIPMGPDVNYSGEKDWSELLVKVYPGADGSFCLYEDAGDGYGYENGEFSIIPMEWNDAEKTLSIGKRSGKYPGMAPEKKLRVVLVGEGHGNGFDFETEDRIISYDGRGIKIAL